MLCIIVPVCRGVEVTYSLLLLKDGGALSASLLLALALLEQGLRDHDLVVGRDSSVN